MATFFTEGGLGGSKSSGGGGRVFPAPVEIFSKFSWLSFGHKNILRGVVRVIFDFTLLSPHPNDDDDYDSFHCRLKIIVLMMKTIMMVMMTITPWVVRK